MPDLIRVLLVDDDPSYCKAMSERLSKNVFQVTVANSGPEALRRAKECSGSLDVAVIDQVMEPPNGIETMQELLAAYPDLEVILLTAYPDQMNQGAEAMRLGAYRYLPKSLDANELALNIELATRYNGERRQRRVLKAILDVDIAMQGATELHELLGKILQGIKSLGYDRGRIYLLDRESERFRGVAEFGGTRNPISEVIVPLSEDRYSSQLITQARPTIFHRGEHEDICLESVEKQDLEEWVELPLISDDVVIGKITVDNRFSRRRFTADDLSDLALFAAPAAAAIERSRRTQEYQNTLETLIDVGHKISAADSETGLSDLIWDQARRILPNLGSVLVSEYDEPNDVVSFFMYSFQGRRVPFSARQRGNGIEEFAIRCRQAYLLPDGDTPFRTSHRLAEPTFPEAQCSSAIVVPMFVEGKVVGTITANSYVPNFSYTQENLKLFQAYANQVAVAIQNVHQITEGKELGAAAEALASRRGFAEIAQNIVTSAHRLIGCDSTGMVIQGRDGILRSVHPTEPPDFFDRLEEPRQQDGISRQVINARQPRVIFDTDKDPLVNQKLRDGGVRSMLAMPLIFANRAIGVLYARTTKLRYFSPHDINLWSAFAAQAAGALYAALEEEEARVWQRLDQDLASCDDLEEVSRLFVKMVRQAMRADFVTFYPYDPTVSQWERVEERQCYWNGDLLTDWEFPHSGKGGGVFQQLLNQALRYLLVNDLENDGGLYQSEFSDQEQIKAFVAVRLAVVPEGQANPCVAGILFVNYRVKTQFRDSDLESLLAACDHGAAAILRLRLQSALQRQEKLRNEQLRAIVSVFQSYRSSKDSREILTRIAAALEQTMAVDICSLLLYDEKTDEFTERGTAGLFDQTRDITVPIEFKTHFLERQTPTTIPDCIQDALMSKSRFVMRERIVSTIVYPLWVEGKPQGLLFASYRQLREFAADEVEGIGIFADLAAMVIHEMRLREALGQTQMKLDRRTILTWVSLLEDTWRHSLIQKASAIRNYVPVLRKSFEQSVLPSTAKVEETLTEVDRLAEEIAKAPLRVPKWSEMQPETFSLARLLEEIVDREQQISALKTTEPRIEIRFEMEDLDNIEIRGFRRWLYYAFESLTQNARNAMPAGGHIAIHGIRKDKFAEIRITDTGDAVPNYIRDKLFSEMIPKEPGKPGMGIGAILAATFVEEHGGTIALEKPGPGDTTVLIRLPIALSSE